MLIGREAELEQLNNRYASGTFQCLMLYGRKGVGKTALIREFIQDKPAIQFSAVAGTALDNLHALSQAIYAFQTQDKVNAPHYQRFEDAFAMITYLAQSQHLILVIDNLSYLENAEPSILTRLHQRIDGPWRDAKLFLILCSSSQRFVEQQVLGPKSPLKESAEPLKLSPLPYRETARWYPDRTPAENALLYGITGGIPRYLNKLQVRGSIQEALLEHLFHPDAYLFDEPERLLRRELRDLSLYNAVLTAMAGGASRLHEIAEITGTGTDACVKYIDVLTAMGIVEKRHPLPTASRRKTAYVISDHFFRFWYRFVRPNLQWISAGRMEQLYPRAVEQHLETYMEHVFRDLCRQYLMHYVSDLSLPIQEIGTWWGTDPRSKEPMQIDIVGRGPASQGPFSSRPHVFAACWYTDTPMGTEDLYQLRYHASLFADFSRACRFYLFSKAGFTDELLDLQRLGEVKLVSLEELYQL